MWLDDARARQLLAPLGSELQSAATMMAIECSWCSQPMIVCRVQRAGLEIDVCPTHGTWFDRHELERVSQVVSHVLGRPVPHAPTSWSHAHPPAGSIPMAEYGPAPSGTGSKWVAGAAAVGAVAAGAAAYAVYSNPQQPPRSSVGSASSDPVGTGLEVIDLGEVGGELADGGAEVAGEALDVAGDAFGSVAEVGGDVAEAAGSVLGAVFEAIGGLFG